MDAGGAVTGNFRSDLNGSVYTVLGNVSAEVPHKIEFSIQYPRAKQNYQGLLWTEGKNAIAGTVTMLDHAYGFIAIREGATLAPEAVELEPKAVPSSKPTYRIVVLEAGSDRCQLDGKAVSPAELTAFLATAVKAEPATRVLVRAQSSVSFERFQQTIRQIEAAGISRIRLAPAGDAGDAGDAN